MTDVDRHMVSEAKRWWRMKISRIKRAYKRYGANGVVWHGAMFLINSIWGSKHQVFIFEAKSPRLAMPQGVRFVRFTEAATIPPSFLQQLQDEEGDDAIESMLTLFSKPAVLWLILNIDTVIGFWWTIRAVDLRKWRVALSVDDIVLFDAYTFTAWRGKNISPAVAEAIVGQETAQGGKGYMDISVRNKASLRAIAKTGFKLVSTRQKPKHPNI